MAHNYNYLEFQNNWSLDEIIIAQKNTINIYERLIIILTKELNQYHLSNWSVIQYKKLIGDWLLTMVQILYDRWQKCENAKNLNFKNNFYIYPINDLEEMVVSDKLNKHLYKCLSILKSNKKLNLKIKDEFEGLSSFTFFSKSKELIQIFAPYSFSYEKSESYSKKLKNIYYNWKLKKISTNLKLIEILKKNYSLDKVWRGAVNNKKINDIEEACLFFCKAFIPIPFLEGFKNLNECAKKFNFFALYTANATNYYEKYIPFKFIAAKWHGETLLLNHQHGGGYGIDIFNMSEFYERSISDRFYTWGWEEDDFKTKILPSNLRFTNNNKKAIRKILLKCVLYPRYIYKLNVQPIGIKNFELIEDTISFVKMTNHLDLEVSQYPNDYGFKLDRIYQKKGVFYKNKSLSEGEYSIHISNYLGTSWLESIAANIPTICFFNLKHYKFRARAYNIIKSFIEVGILHTTSKSAAEKLLSINDNPLGWWKSKKVQRLRESFVKSYANFSEDWRYFLFKELEEVKKLKR